MSELLYIKYNSHRKPEFQLSTRIVSENGTKTVVKAPSTDKAQIQIEAIKRNYGLLNNYYNSIKVIPFQQLENGLSFDFIEGTSIVEDIDYEKDELDVIYKKLLDAMEVVLDVKEEFLCDFIETGEFISIFPGMHPKGKAFSICNIDSIFSNFIKTDDGVVCLDYEWVLDFPIPVDFVRYRLIQNIYNEKHGYLFSRVSNDEFLGCLGLSDDEIDMYSKMELLFQYHVHGENLKYIYLDNYKKSWGRLDDFIVEFKEKENHVKNLEEIINNKNAILESNQNKLDTALKTIENLEDQLKAKDIHIQNMADIIESQDNHIEILKGEVEDIKAAKEQQARDYDSLMSYEMLRRDNDIRYRDGLLQVKDGQLQIKDIQIQQRDQQISRMLKNPLYYGYKIGRKVGSKAYYALESDEHKTERELIAQIGEVEYKYGYLREYDKRDYASWIQRVEASYPPQKKLKYNPKISVLVPVYNVLDKHLIPCIESVVNQTYDNWELCLADDNSSWDNVKEVLKLYEDNPKIKIVYRKENGHISKATNSALEVATGEFVGLLDCDDLLSPNALYEVALKLNENKSLDFIYSDEDKVDDDGENRHMPHFKPDWSPDTLMSNMYACHFAVYRKTLVDKVGGLRTECNGSQDYDLALRIMDETTPDRIAHIDKILYHWREREESTSGNATVKPYVFEAAKKAKLDSLKRRGLSGEAVFVDEMYQYNIVYDIQGNPKVSIIIPSKDNFDVLSRCIETVYSYTDYKNFEVILVDNGSNEENKTKYQSLADKHGFVYLYEEFDFNFSKMCNIGAKKATGDYLLLLNDDIEILEESKSWLKTMLGQAQVSYTGAVGARLLYPDNKGIQHVGVINIENGPVHAFTGMSDEPIYYFGRNRLHFNVLAVTAACLMINKDKYWEVGGIDESFAVAYNDVDFCMKLVENGYFNVVRNDVVLIHHESVSRGNDLVDINKTRRLMNEENRLYSIHPKFAHYDPFYNRNLTQVRPDFSNNVDDYKLEISNVKKKNVKAEEIKDVETNIDYIIVERYISIEGWAFVKGKEDNNSIVYKLVLKGEKNTYVVDTYKVYREDVVLNHMDERDIEFTGFRCRFDRRMIEDGVYKLYLLGDGMIDTDKSFEK